MRVPCNCFATEFNMNPACFCMPHESASQAREDAKVGCAMGSCSWRRAGLVTKLDAHWYKAIWQRPSIINVSKLACTATCSPPEANSWARPRTGSGPFSRRAVPKVDTALFSSDQVGA
jgi:hypothetical protein